jgi:hypothetical protein
MERVLGAIEDTFVAAEVDLPERRYITFGTPPADCAQLTVALQQLYLGPPGAPVSEPTPCSSPTTAVLRVELLREVPIPQDRDLTVAVPKLIASAKEQIKDAELLLESTGPMCGATWGAGGLFADVLMGVEQGMFAGPVMNLTIGVP